jgi:hypothetical protein
MKINGRYGFASGAMTSAVLLLAGSHLAVSSNAAQSYEQYAALLDKVPMYLDRDQAEQTKAIMRRTMLAHHERDTDAAIAELGEDYSWNRIVESGAVTLAKGRETAEAVTRGLYESGDYLEKYYLGADSTPLAVVGNLGVQLEIENYRNEDGSTRVTRSLVIYEMKDGKLWRLWGFVPVEGDGSSAG